MQTDLMKQKEELDLFLNSFFFSPDEQSLAIISTKLNEYLQLSKTKPLVFLLQPFAEREFNEIVELMPEYSYELVTNTAKTAEWKIYSLGSYLGMKLYLKVSPSNFEYVTTWSIDESSPESSQVMSANELKLFRDNVQRLMNKVKTSILV